MLGRVWGLLNSITPSLPDTRQNACTTNTRSCLWSGLMPLGKKRHAQTAGRGIWSRGGPTANG